MTAENMKKERFDQLGLPPMELAESSANNQNNNGVYKCLLPAMKKIMLMLSLTILGIGIYALLSNILAKYDDTRNTRIILIRENSDSTDITNFIKIYNATVEDDDFNTRNKRDAAISSAENTFDWDEFSSLNFDDEKLQKARDIIMKHDIQCDEKDKQGICKDLVAKLREITAKNVGTKHDEASKNTLEDNDINDGHKTNHSEAVPTDVAKREALHHTHVDSIDTIPLSLLSGNMTQHEQPHNCLMNLLKKYPREKEMFDPTAEYLTHHDINYEQPLSPHARFYSPAAHAPYSQTRGIDTPRPKVHPQDVDIIMRFLTPPSQLTSAEHPSNISRKVSCPPDTRPCLNGDTCIAEKLWCDGNVDCADISDEAQCNCKSRVDASRLCDGYFDCPFGEDEMGCYGCRANMFSCEDLDMNSQSTCFTKEQRCDSIADCPNHKDEVECNTLAPSLLKTPIFPISNTEGFLHRNYKGEWYAVCKNPYMWAHDVCRRETGHIIRPPFIQRVPIDPMLKMNYINADAGGLVQTGDSCLKSSAIYVTCPDVLCGTRVQSTTQLLRENAAIESHLYGRNKRHYPTNHPYPLMFYGSRWKRNADDFSAKTDFGIKFDTLKNEDSLDKMRNKRTESRVVGGKPSQPAAWPWMVAMYRDGMFHCGGVVITHSWVISAAHCVSKFWDHYYEIQVGMLRRFSYSPQEQSHKVTHIIVNQHYSQSDMKNDLSLLKVEPVIQFSRWVRPICLPNPDTAGPGWLWGPAAGTICTAVGWGATTEHGPDPDHMREVEVPIWESCKHKEDRAGKEICAGLTEGGKDACQGDSGGPLLCRNPLNSQQWYMAGIVSHGDGCGRKDEPGVYTRVSLFVKWIKYHTSSDSLPLIQPKQECPGFKCESGISKCLPNKRRCDRIVDCLDADDEINCEFTTTVSPSFLPSPKSDFIDHLFDTKEANTDSNTSVSSNKLEVDTTTLSNIELSTTETEPITIENYVDTKSRESESSDISLEDQEPDFKHASTVEMTISKSTENSVSGSEEHVTADPESTFSNESSPKSLGDAETITIEHVGKPIESESSVLEKLRVETTVNGDLVSTTEKYETTTSTTIEHHVTMESSTTNFKENDDPSTLDTIEITTHISFPDYNEVSFITTHNPLTNNIEDRETKSEGDIIRLLPNSGDIPDQTAESTQYVKEKELIEKNDNQKPIPKKLSDFDDQMEDMVISEIQPATLKRRPRIPKKFQCHRIYQIIPHYQRCDRKADCEDGTDELDCTCSDYLASFDEKLICDGVFDCADGHDESNCYSCGDDKFLCKQSQVCVPLKKVCDGKPHCPQGEDELDCFTLSNGKEIEYDLDERPVINLEGYLTNKHHNDWHVVCDDTLTFEQQEQAATHICHYLGFSSANKFDVKYINLKEDEIIQRSMVNNRKKRDTVERVPIHFAYRQASEGNDTSRRIIIKDAQVIKEQCVPNITKTCKSLYVYCDRSLFTDFDKIENIYLRNTETAHKHMWPWAAKIFIEGHYKCTGVLVNLSWVLVSESCLWDATLGHHYITAVLGSHRTLESINGMHEQVYPVDAKKYIYRSKSMLLHLKHPAHYSNFVKPMVVVSSFNYIDSNSTCVALGQDVKNNTISVNLQETRKNCNLSNRCFVRKSKENICPHKTLSHRPWSGIISCHTDQGWFPAASFVDSRGECGLGDHINATDIENLKNEINYFRGKNILEVPENNIFDDYNNMNCEGIRCGRGRCVSMVHMCDGVKDCEDGNDESESACSEKKTMCNIDPYHNGCECKAGEMKCRNGNCVAKKLFRDGNNDCGDGTDEPGQATCLQYLKRIMPSRLCDGILHCHDRSDEDPMFCKCFAKRTYKCGTKSDVDYCVAPDMVCDGIRDCPNGEDENTCIGLNAPHGTPHGTGQVIVRSHGVWYSKCYPTQNHTKGELEAICAELGFLSGHAKQIFPTDILIEYQHNNYVLDSFNDIILNNNTQIKMRSAPEPLATAIFDEKLPNCYPVFIECL